MTIALTELQEDALCEVFNIGAGTGAAVLNSMLQSHIHLNIPKIAVLTKVGLTEKLSNDSGENLSTVEMGFQGNINGNSLLFFPKDSAAKLVAALTGEELEPDDDDDDGLFPSTMNEIGNIVMNGVIGAISNVLGYSLNYSVPNYSEEGKIDVDSLSKVEVDSVFLFADTVFAVEDLNISGDIVIVLGVDAFGKILEKVDSLMTSYDTTG